MTSYMIPKLAWTVFGGALALTVLVLLLLALVLTFEIWMFVDVLQNPHISSDRKILWAIGMVLIHPFVAIIYYFTDHNAPL